MASPLSPALSPPSPVNAAPKSRTLSPNTRILSSRDEGSGTAGAAFSPRLRPRKHCLWLTSGRPLLLLLLLPADDARAAKRTSAESNNPAPGRFEQSGASCCFCRCCRCWLWGLARVACSMTAYPRCVWMVEEDVASVMTKKTGSMCGVQVSTRRADAA